VDEIKFSGLGSKFPEAGHFFRKISEQPSL